MRKDTFIIEDLPKFIEQSRILVFDSFSENKDNVLNTDISKMTELELSELESILSQKECMLICKDFIREKVNKHTKETQILITEEQYLKMVEAFNTRMISNLLTNLVNKGLVDSAYDDTKNDFVFWLKK